MKILALTTMIFTASAANAEAPKTNDPQELKKIIAQKDKEIENLKNKQLNSVEPAAGQVNIEPENKLIRNKFQYHKE